MSSVGVRDYSVSEGNIPSIIASRVDSSVQLRSGQSVQKELRRGKDDSRGTMSNSHIGRNEREQVTVRIKCSITNVAKIDTAKQEFTCTLVMCATWREPRLKGKTIEEPVEWNLEWLPRIVLLNAVHLDKTQREHRLFYKDQDEIPYAQERCRIRGTFTQAMQLHDFPFDFQELTITLSSEQSSSAVLFDKDMTEDDVILQENFLPSRDWSLCRHVITSQGTDTSRACDHSVYSIHFHVKRKSQFYLWSVVLVLLFIGMLALSTFSIPVADTANRLTVTFILLLTAVAVRLGLSGTIRNITHLTLLDKYVLSSLFFLFVVAIGHAVVGVVPDPLEQKSVDRIWLYVTVVLFVFGQLIALCFTLRKISKVDKMLKDLSQIYEVTSDEIERQRKERAWYAEKRARDGSSHPNGLDKPVFRQDQDYRPVTPLSNKAYV